MSSLLFIRCAATSRFACLKSTKQSVSFLSGLARRRDNQGSLLVRCRAGTYWSGVGGCSRRCLHTGGSASTDSSSMEGTCLCKAIALKVTDDDLFGEKRRGHLCHCSNCRKVAGGLFGANLIVEEGKVEWVRGRDVVKVYEVRDVSGFLSVWCG